MALLATLMRWEGTLVVIQRQDAGQRTVGAITNCIAVWEKTVAVRIRSAA